MKANRIIMGLMFLAYANFGALGATATHHKKRLEREKNERGRQTSHTTTEETDDSNELLERYEVQRAKLEKDKNEREEIDQENEQWMKEQNTKLDNIIEEKSHKIQSKYMWKLFDINAKDRQWRYFKASELKKSLGITDSDKRMKYLMEHAYENDLYSDGALLCEYYDTSEINEFYFIALTEYSIALAQPLSRKYQEELKKESGCKDDWQFLVGSSTVIQEPSAIFLYDNGKDVVPMRISLDKDYFKMYITEIPVQLPASVSDYFMHPELIDKRKLKRMARLTMWSAYSDLVFDDNGNYIFRQEEVETNDGYIPCIVVRQKSQNNPTPLSTELKQKISQLKL